MNSKPNIPEGILGNEPGAHVAYFWACLCRNYDPQWLEAVMRRVVEIDRNAKKLIDEHNLLKLSDAEEKVAFCALGKALMEQKVLLSWLQVFTDGRPLTYYKNLVACYENRFEDIAAEDDTHFDVLNALNNCFWTFGDREVFLYYLRHRKIQFSKKIHTVVRAIAKRKVFTPIVWQAESIEEYVCEMLA